MGRFARERRSDGDDGFTLVEVMMAMLIGVIAMTALAALLFSSMKMLTIHKARSRGNEIATQAIEDLQRLKYEQLGLCASPSAPIPTDLADIVMLPACSPSTVAFAPCPSNSATPPAGSVPDEEYTCTDRGTTYNIRRFVSFGDVGHTEKRLAVFVSWRDQVGTHEVSQQSSLRIPSRSLFVGPPPPSITPSVNPISVPTSAGLTTADVNVTATATGMSSGDSMVVGFRKLVDGLPRPASVSLAWIPSTAQWEGVIPAGTQVGNGQQYLTFTGIRSSDSKVGSRINPAPVTFGTPSSAVNVFATSVPSSVQVDATGGLLAPFVVEVRTEGVASGDLLEMMFHTQAGVVSLSLEPLDADCEPDAACSRDWRTTVQPSTGYLFDVNVDNLFFSVYQGVGPNAVSVGDTDAVSMTVDFQS